MKNFLLSITLITSITASSFASFPVHLNDKSEEVNIAKEEMNTLSIKDENNVAKLQKSIDSKVKKRLGKKIAKKGYVSEKDNDIAIVLAIVSVLFLPFGLHNWYLGRYKQAIWQTLLTFPGVFLIIPFFVSWIWQIVDLVKLIKGTLDY